MSDLGSTLTVFLNFPVSVDQGEVCVPRISAFYGIVITIWWNDHPPPHFHAWYAGTKAKVDIATGDVIEGHLPPRARRLVRAWARVHTDELLANWERARIKQDLLPIEPLP